MVASLLSAIAPTFLFLLEQRAIVPDELAYGYSCYLCEVCWTPNDDWYWLAWLTDATAWVYLSENDCFAEDAY